MGVLTQERNGFERLCILGNGEKRSNFCGNSVEWKITSNQNGIFMGCNYITDQEYDLGLSQNGGYAEIGICNRETDDKPYLGIQYFQINP